MWPGADHNGGRELPRDWSTLGPSVGLWPKAFGGPALPAGVRKVLETLHERRMRTPNRKCKHVLYQQSARVL